MPVRSLSWSVLKWPDAQTTELALRQWVQKAVAGHAGVLRIGYFGSLARGEWGVGSDLDLVIIMESADQPFEKRSVQWDTTELPVPVDLLVYTKGEWESLSQTSRFYQTLMRETVWIYTR